MTQILLNHGHENLFTYRGVERHFTEVAAEAGLNPRDYNLRSKEDQAKIIAGWVRVTYRSECTTGGHPLTLSTQAEERQLTTHNIQHGQSRIKEKTQSWDEERQKDHQAWMGRRRGKGLQRAPKWQQVAGGRRSALISVRTMQSPTSIEVITRELEELLFNYETS